MSNPTVTDLFCGAGGSSLGAVGAGLELVLAANHWQTAIDVHQANFPEAEHDCADVSQVDPRRYPRTDVLLASPECTNHSQARGVSRRKQQPSLFDSPDPAAERSRATMWDVPRFAEQMRYEAIVVENVVEATKWVGWRGWHQVMADLGYSHKVLSLNSMFNGVPQSRDRVYVVFWLGDRDPDLELELKAWCLRCDAWRTVRQGWKNGRTVGRYRQQWTWNCVTCNTICEPATEPAAKIIDWSLECPRIGDRSRPLAKATRARILAGLQRYGWAPIITAGAGNTFERTPGNRSRSLQDPLPVQHTTPTTAMATPPAFLFANNANNVPRPVGEPLATATTGNRHGLVIPLRNNARSRSLDESLSTVCTNVHHGLLMRNNGGGAEMVTPVVEPARTITTKGHQSLLLPYNGAHQSRTLEEPIGVITGSARWSLLEADRIVDDCGFRMLEPHEIAAAMAFPEGYISETLTKRDRVKLAGNAVTPPVMAWILGRVVQALEGAP